MFRCVGCGSTLEWDGITPITYSCPCGATVFVHDESGRVALPSSVAVGGRAVVHLDSLVGRSTFTSPEKEEVITELKKKGYIWMEECEQCRKDGTLERQLRLKELENQLEQVRARVRSGELTKAAGVKELLAIREGFGGQGQQGENAK